MPNYKTHNYFNCIIALPISLYVLLELFSFPLKYTLTFSASFLYATFFMNPDLDLAGQIKLRSIRGVLSIPFRLYAKIFKHRGLSHRFFWGTLSRLIWLVFFFLAISFFIEFSFFNREELLYLYKQYKPFLWFGFCGIIIADLSHLLLDKR